MSAEVHISKSFSRAHIFRMTDPTSKDLTATMLEMLKREILKQYIERETDMYFYLFYICDPTVPFNSMCEHLNGLLLHVKWPFKHALWLSLAAICFDIEEHK
jgi:hypothetical protein